MTTDPEPFSITNDVLEPSQPPKHATESAGVSQDTPVDAGVDPSIVSLLDSQRVSDALDEIERALEEIERPAFERSGGSKLGAGSSSRKSSDMDRPVAKRVLAGPPPPPPPPPPPVEVKRPRAAAPVAPAAAPPAPPAASPVPASPPAATPVAGVSAAPPDVAAHAISLTPAVPSIKSVADLLPANAGLAEIDRALSESLDEWKENSFQSVNNSANIISAAKDAKSAGPSGSTAQPLNARPSDQTLGAAAPQPFQRPTIDSTAVAIPIAPRIAMEEAESVRSTLPLSPPQPAAQYVAPPSALHAATDEEEFAALAQEPLQQGDSEPLDQPGLPGSRSLLSMLFAPLAMILMVLSLPVRWTPPRFRPAVSWAAVTLMLWVPVVWAYVWWQIKGSVE